MPMAVADIAEILDRRKLGAFQKGVIALCTAIVFVEGMNAQSAGYVGPVLREAWKLTPSELGLFFASGLFGLMFGGLFVAPFADRIGRRPILIACVALFGICSLATAASPSITIMDALRFLTGLGIGGAMPSSPRGGWPCSSHIAFPRCGWPTGSWCSRAASWWIRGRTRSWWRGVGCTPSCSACRRRV